MIQPDLNPLGRVWSQAQVRLRNEIDKYKRLPPMLKKKNRLLPIGVVVMAGFMRIGEANAATDYTVSAPGITIKLSAKGRVTGVRLGKAEDFKAVHASSFLQGCTIIGQAVVHRLSGGGVEFTLALNNPIQKRHCSMMEKFFPGRHSIAWRVRIAGKGAPWSTSINTALAWPLYPGARRVRIEARKKNLYLGWTYGLAAPAADSSKIRFWTGWTSPDQCGRLWENPLRPRRFTKHTWIFGTHYIGADTGQGSFSIPLASVIDPTHNSGLSLVLSPRDVILGLFLKTTRNGSILFRRTHLQIGGGTTVQLTMHLVPQQASWRGGLQWMVHHYPKYFNPPNPAANQMGGCGAYTGYENPIDVPKFKAMAFRTLWQLSDDFCYQGMFIPPVTSAAERWHRSMGEPNPPGKPDWMTCQRLERGAEYLKTNGFNLLMYFNATEFGKNMNDPIRHKADTPDLWKYPRAFLKYDLPHAALVPHITTDYNAWVMDCGDPAHRKFLLQQAARMIKMVPDAAGICIDRLDWLRKYNLNAHDGVSWANGKSARSLLQSWKGLMAKLGPLEHKGGKVIFVNIAMNDPRLDLMRHADGADSEGDTGPALNALGLLCVRKPAILWTFSTADLKPDPNAYFQRHLYMGVYPYAPFPWNNHAIQPAAWANKYYLDYGPLLNAMRGKQWVLTPHCVAVNNPHVKVNLFRVPGGYVAPVVLGGQTASVMLTIRNVPGLTAEDRCQALYPGKPGGILLGSRFQNHMLTMVVPLVRGCAMVEVKAITGG